MEPRDKSRKLIYIWASTFERLKAMSDATRKPMTELCNEAVSLLAARYPVEPTLKEGL
jgi:hypothetical protein